jgi:acyl-CoA synthetase (AMP-forming)/AMP-acid ligase II
MTHKLLQQSASIIETLIQELSRSEISLVLPSAIEDAFATHRAIQEALAQPVQEPVAWITPSGEGFRLRLAPPENDVPLAWDALYASPPQRQPLSDEQIIDLAVQWPAETNDWASHFDFARAIEAKLKEKNT